MAETAAISLQEPSIQHHLQVFLLQPPQGAGSAQHRGAGPWGFCSASSSSSSLRLQLSALNLRGDPGEAHCSQLAVASLPVKFFTGGLNQKQFPAGPGMVVIPAGRRVPPLGSDMQQLGSPELWKVWGFWGQEPGDGSFWLPGQMRTVSARCPPQDLASPGLPGPGPQLLECVLVVDGARGMAPRHEGKAGRGPCPS